MPPRPIELPAPRHAFEHRVARHHTVEQPRLRILAGVCGIEPLLVGQDDEDVRIDEVGHERAERVVVPNLDFVGCDGVVFIDDGHDPMGEQGSQR